VIDLEYHRGDVHGKVRGLITQAVLYPDPKDRFKDVDGVEHPMGFDLSPDQGLIQRLDGGANGQRNCTGRALGGECSP